MIGSGLALEQAPPFSAPLRFFLTAPLFLAAAGLLAAWRPEWAGDISSRAALALTHLVTLGFLAMVMIGALTQMLPVVAGTPLPRVMGVARLSHGGLLLGTPCLAWGLAQGDPMALEIGAALLGAGLAVFLAAAALGLSRARPIDTVHAMRLAVVALAVTLALGIGLAGWLTGRWLPHVPISWLHGHILWGLGGWIGVLVMGVAWQVVPMLQLTPAYPARMPRAMLWTAVLCLPAAAWLDAPWRTLGEAGLGALLILFAGLTLDLQRRRKRKLGDATLDFWRLGMVNLILACLLMLLPFPDPAPLMAGIAFLVGFAVSVVTGMLYKILPFLAWFHLQGQRGMTAGGLPSMKDYLPDARARGQFRLHGAALACLLAAPMVPPLARPGGLLLAASAVWLAWNLWRGVALFRASGGRLASPQDARAGSNPS